jgi:hypothetical protein
MASEGGMRFAGGREVGKSGIDAWPARLDDDRSLLRVDHRQPADRIDGDRHRRSALAKIAGADLQHAADLPLGERRRFGGRIGHEDFEGTKTSRFWNSQVISAPRPVSLS